MQFAFFTYCVLEITLGALVFSFFFTATQQPIFNKVNLGWRLRPNIKLELFVLQLFWGFAGPTSFLPFAVDHYTQDSL